MFRFQDKCQFLEQLIESLSALHPPDNADSTENHFFHLKLVDNWPQKPQLWFPTLSRSRLPKAEFEACTPRTGITIGAFFFL